MWPGRLRTSRTRSTWRLAPVLLKMDFRWYLAVSELTLRRLAAVERRIPSTSISASRISAGDRRNNLRRTEARLMGFPVGSSTKTRLASPGTWPRKLPANGMRVRRRAGRPDFRSISRAPVAENPVPATAACLSRYCSSVFWAGWRATRQFSLERRPSASASNWRAVRLQKRILPFPFKPMTARSNASNASSIPWLLDRSMASSKCSRSARWKCGSSACSSRPWVSSNGPRRGDRMLLSRADGWSGRAISTPKP